MLVPIQACVDMVASMRQVVRLSTTELTMKERDLLSVAYKKVINVHRSSWRIVCSVEQRGKRDVTAGLTSSSPQLPLVSAFRTTIQGKIIGLCDDIVDLLDKHVLPFATTPESRVYYLTMKGDYLRYLIEASAAEERSVVSEKAQEVYQAATTIAAKHLAPSNTTRLGLALNFAVLYYEVLDEPEAASDLAQKAFDKALGDIDSFDDPIYKDAIMLMMLLKDNLLHWRSENPEACDPQYRQGLSL